MPTIETQTGIRIQTNKALLMKTATSLAQQLSLKNQIHRVNTQELREEIIAGLLAPTRYISSKFLYGNRGASLFDLITQTEEYYPTRIEKQILSKVGNLLFTQSNNLELIELGCGDCSKIAIVLNAIPPYHMDTITYRPIDINESTIQQSTRELKIRFPLINIDGIVADFTKQLPILPKSKPRIFCFYGSTVGNLEPGQALALFNLISESMQSGDQFLVGVDRIKDRNIMEAAYNDSQRFTEAFNRNIIRIVNDLLKSEMIPTYFEHEAFYNETLNRIEMHLRAKYQVEITSPYLAEKITIKAGETIHTENAYKYSEAQIVKMASDSSLTVNNLFSDPNEWFTLVQLIK